MKKVFLMAAFVGLLASSAVAHTFGDDKDKKTTKKECSKDGKSCAGEKGAKGEKACCKDKHATAEKTTNTSDTKATKK